MTIPDGGDAKETRKLPSTSTNLNICQGFVISPLGDLAISAVG
jgi:hypothetical protein